MTRLVAIIACITVIDCLTGAFAFMNGIIPPPSGEISMGWKIAIGIVAAAILAWQAVRFSMWVASLVLRRTGRAGRSIGRALIRGMTCTRRHGMLHEATVRWLWLQVEGRRLKSVATIARRVRGEVAVRRQKPVYDGPRLVVSNERRVA